jgi:hypothetical protein
LLALGIHRQYHGPQQDTYLVLEDFGQLGRAWRETDENATDRQTLIRDLVEGEFSNPVRIVAFSIAEGWCRDVTVDIADELRLLRCVSVFSVSDCRTLSIALCVLMGPRLANRRRKSS